MTPARGVIGSSGPADLGNPSINKTASFDPSGEKRGASTDPFSSARLTGALPSTAAVQTCAAGTSPGRSARKQTCLESADQETSRSPSLPSTATARVGPPLVELRLNSPPTMYANCDPSGEMTTWSILLARGMESTIAAAREGEAACSPA